MTRLSYQVDPDNPTAPPIGLIVLQVDETLEPEIKAYFQDTPNPTYVTRIPSAPEVTVANLKGMETDLAAAATLLPTSRQYGAIGYGCTSASSVIGSKKVEALIKSCCDAQHVTDPLRATIANAQHMGVSRFALLSPYVEEVNTPLRASFAAHGITTDVFGSFEQPNEATVARISMSSIVDAASQLGSDPSVDSVFLSCTNLRTLDAIPLIQDRIGKPVLSSNQSLAWHLKHLVSV